LGSGEGSGFIWKFPGSLDFGRVALARWAAIWPRETEIGELGTGLSFRFQGGTGRGFSLKLDAVKRQEGMELSC
jgi:hypothetical protein